MVTKRLLRPERRRRVPTHFSWIDHRLVREHHIERCDPDACALYLFLVTVADAKGLSYYADASISARLTFDEPRLHAARARLVAADLIAFEAPLYQVLELAPPASPSAAHTAVTPSLATPGLRSITEILRTMGGQQP